jgi:hypothetical protein
MAMGLKNAEAALYSVDEDIDFAVNEQCATYAGGCSSYEAFLRSGKPVFHIEYAIPETSGSRTILKADSPNADVKVLNTSQLQALYCLRSGIEHRQWLGVDVPRKFSTVIKTMDLSKWTMYCDGTTVT